MCTHIFRDSTGQDLLSFSRATLSTREEATVKTRMHYFGVELLADLVGEKIDVAEDGETVIGTSPYTIKVGTRLYYDAELVWFKSGVKYLSICVEDEEDGDICEVRINV